MIGAIESAVDSLMDCLWTTQGVGRSNGLNYRWRAERAIRQMQVSPGNVSQSYVRLLIDYVAEQNVDCGRAARSDSGQGDCGIAINKGAFRIGIGRSNESSHRPGPRRRSDGWSSGIRPGPVTDRMHGIVDRKRSTLQ